LVYALGRQRPRPCQTAFGAAQDDRTVQSDSVVAAESAGGVDAGSCGDGDDASLSEWGWDSASGEFGSATAGAWAAAAASDGDAAVFNAIASTWGSADWSADWAARRSWWTGRD
jgi:hypothetical protein